MPLSPHVPDLPALELLLDVAASGSIGAAARTHGITQQAASARLRSLERQVGLRLLVRGPGGSRPTEAGAVLVAWAAQVVAAAVELDNALTALRRQGTARLRLAASMTIAEHLVPGWLGVLRGRTRPGVDAPTVTLTATNSDTVAGLVRAGSVDLGMVEGPDPLADLGQQLIGCDRLVLVVAPDHPWARRRRAVSPAELAQTPLVTREPGSGTRQALEQALHRARDVQSPAGVGLVAPAMEFGTATALREAVRAGWGPAVLSVLAVGADLRDQRLIAVRTTGLDLTRRLRAVWAGSAPLPTGPARVLVAIAARSGPGPGQRGRGG